MVPRRPGTDPPPGIHHGEKVTGQAHLRANLHSECVAVLCLKSLAYAHPNVTRLLPLYPLQ